MKLVFHAVLLSFIFAFRILPAHSCAMMPHRPEDQVRVTKESAVIIWDAANKRQHFIRGATFEGATRDIGFLVPSPAIPELKEARLAAFDILEKTLQPKVEHRNRNKYEWTLMGAIVKSVVGVGGSDFDTAAARAPGGVEVLQTQSVAGYDAATLKASDTAQLNRWLAKNGYIAKPDFASWLEPYVNRGWVITAFKIQKPGKEDKVFSSSLVRMSFNTPKPFFPYREPAGQREGAAKDAPRSLRVFFIGDQRMEGAIGETVQRAWPGKAMWSDELDNHLNIAQKASLARSLALGANQLPAKMRMTSFEDLSSPRPGTDDVYFKAAGQQEAILPPPIIIWHDNNVLIPLDALVALGLALLLIYNATASLKRQR